MKFLIVLSALLAVGFAVDLNGQCPSVQVVQNFDIPRYTGLWNEIYRFETAFQPGGECVTAEYTLNQSSIVIVLNSMVINNTLFSIEGTAIPAPNANGSAMLLVQFPGNTTITTNYWVLSTDYDSYALVYSCINLGTDRKRLSSWILSRTNYLKPESVLSMNPAMQVVDGLEWSSYRRTNHSESTCASNSNTNSNSLLLFPILSLFLFRHSTQK